MDEKKIRKLLTRLTVIVALISIALFLFTGGIVYYLFASLRTYTREQMQVEAREYKSRILKQIDNDFQLLHSLSTFLSFSDSLSRQDLVEGLYQTNATNNFVSMALFFPDGSGMIETLEYGTSPDYPLASSHPYVQEAVNRALSGQDAVSLMFESQISGDLVYIYAVPVLQNDQIAGALCASDHLEIFEEILGGNTVLNGNGYIHMLSDNGKFLVRSKHSIVSDPDMTSIFDGPYIAEDQKQSVRAAMQSQQGLFSTFRYEDKECLFYLEPMGINGWYLFCVNRLADASGALYPLLLVVGAAFAIMLTLSSFLLFYGYKTLRRNSKQLLHVAYFDSLTGAENMLRFTQRIDEFLPRRLPYSIVAVNIRRFKFINELFGQEQGDQLLCYVMQIIKAQMREGEFFCRDAADLFYLLIRDIQEVSIRQRLDDIVHKVGQAALSRQNHYEISLYCGVAINGNMMQALLALQSIKHTYHSDVAFYDEKLHQKERFKNRIESHMQSALQNGEFRLFLQPKMRLSDDGLAGAEALVRWQDASGTLYSPGDFIPVFESNGFCARLDMYMLEAVCRQLRAWLDAGITPVPLSVNQSKLLFYESDYISNLQALVERYRVPAGLITLEILEGLAADNMVDLNAKIRQLHELGFRVSMDDFGSGYSSLNTLYQLNIDELKLDQGFLLKSAYGAGTRRRVILEHIVQLAQRLSISTVVEGVETRENADWMRSLGCDYAQGYLYSKPISAAAFDVQYMHLPCPALP